MRRIWDYDEHMHFLKKNRFRVAVGLVTILGLGLIYLIASGSLTPLPDITSFKSKHYSFDYPRTYNAREYASGVVSVGTVFGDMLIPYVEVTRYQSDPDVAIPGSFDAFMKRQASALCGTDGSVESITCTQVGVTPYTSPKGLSGQTLNLTLVHKNLKSGTTTSSTYGPFYVFNTTATPRPDAPLRYSAIFIYPALSAFLSGTTTPELMQQVIGTFALPTPVSTVTK